MTYDETLAARVRRVLARCPEIVEKRMFGGLAFMLDGKMLCGVVNDDLMVRVGPDAYEAALARPHARAMDFTGRPLTGLVYVGPAGTRTAAAITAWTERAAAFVTAQPRAKPRKKPRARPWPGRGARGRRKIA